MECDVPYLYHTRERSRLKCQMLVNITSISEHTKNIIFFKE
jgi:hypothetical protein